MFIAMCPRVVAMTHSVHQWTVQVCSPLSLLKKENYIPPNLQKDLLDLYNILSSIIVTSCI